MREFWQKSELGFFFLWLWIYLLVQNAGEMLSQAVGVRYFGTALLNLLLAGTLFQWLRRQNLLDDYGLGPVKIRGKNLFWFSPLLLISTQNLWGGAVWRLPFAETWFCVVTMACVGFLEELLMRGFLFRYLKKKSMRTAVVLSTLAFGGAHGLNLGTLGLVESLLQIVGALCFGLLCAILLLRSGSLWPCILSHSTINVLSVFAAAEGKRLLLISAVHMALMLTYTAVLIRTDKTTYMK